jgi:hypothetical protein
MGVAVEIDFIFTMLFAAFEADVRAAFSGRYRGSVETDRLEHLGSEIALQRAPPQRKVQTWDDWSY